MPRKITKAIIDEHAFVALTSAALEVFDNETYGMLIGSQYKTRIRIKNAIAYQRATRKKSEVSVFDSHEIKMRHIVNDLTGYKVLGDFHSHPHWPNYLSDHDVKAMIEDGERITLLLTILPSTKIVKWHFDRVDKSLRGSFHDYLVIIKVYIREYDRKVVKKLKIECPFIKKMNKTLEKYTPWEKKRRKRKKGKKKKTRKRR